MASADMYCDTKQGSKAQAVSFVIINMHIMKRWSVS